MTEDLSKSPIRLRNTTATDMAILFGLNPYESPSSLVERKTNPKPISSNHMRRGKLFEPAVLEAFLLDANMPTERHIGSTIELPEYRIAATPDAYVLGTKNVVECKSVMTKSIDKWYDEIPASYQIQVMVQMLVVGSEVGYIGALEEGDPTICKYRFVAWKVNRHEEIEELMKQESLRFWEDRENNKLFRVSSKVKKRVSELLPVTRELIIPPNREDIKTHEQYLSEVLSIFES